MQCMSAVLLKGEDVQLGEKNVEEFAVAVTEPRVAVWTVTVDPETVVTTPVTSSTKSSWPVARLEVVEVGASTDAVRTPEAVRSTAEITWGVELRVKALDRLNWICTPTCWLLESVIEKEEVAGVEAVVWLTCATVPVAQP